MNEGKKHIEVTNPLHTKIPNIQHNHVVNNNKSNTDEKNRNSWIDMEELNTIPTLVNKRTTILLLGNVSDLDQQIYSNIKYGQRLVGTFGVIAVIFFIINGATSISANGKDILYWLAIIFGAMTVLSFLLIYYKNFSFAIFLRLCRQLNVVVIIIAGIFNLIIEFFSNNVYSAAFGLVYFLCVVAFILSDSMKVKSRNFTLLVGTMFIVINLWNIYTRVFGTVDYNVALARYTINGKKIILWKRSVQRSIFLHVLLFSMSGMYTLIKDKKMELLMFATGNIYRSTGIGIVENPSTTIDTAETIDDDDEDNNKKKIQSNTTNNINKRKSILLLGEEVEIDDSLQYRVKWGQRAAGVFSLTSLIIWNFLTFDSYFEYGIYLFFTFLSLSSLCTVYYKNVSFSTIKYLKTETNVIVILGMSFCNEIVEIVRPSTPFSPISGIMLILIVIAFLVNDAIKKKSRAFVLIIGIIFMLILSSNVYHLTFGDWGLDENGNPTKIIIEYTIQNKKFIIDKRSSQRGMFIQMVLFSLNAIWIMIIDKDMKLMLFATGNLYRHTGTAMPFVKDETFTSRVENET